MSIRIFERREGQSLVAEVFVDDAVDRGVMKICHVDEKCTLIE